LNVPGFVAEEQANVTYEPEPVPDYEKLLFASGCTFSDIDKIRSFIRCLF